MSAHEKALEKSKKKGMKGKALNEDDSEGKELDEKGKKPKKEFGSKNNDSEEN